MHGINTYIGYTVKYNREPECQEKYHKRNKNYMLVAFFALFYLKFEDQRMHSTETPDQQINGQTNITNEIMLKTIF